MQNYKAIVLAGGVGSRLRPLTSDVPKPMNPVGGYPMIDYNLQMLKNTGIKDVVIVVRYLGDEIIEYVGDGSRYGLNVTFPEGIDPLGTADAVRLSAEYIGDSPFICTMADVVTNLDLGAFIKFHESKKGKITSISLKHVNQPRAFGVTMLSSEEEILLFLEKPMPQELYLATLTFQLATTHLHYNLVNMGIYIFENSIFDLLNTFPDVMDFGKEVFPLILSNRRKNEKIFGFVSNPYWMDAGNPQKYMWANWDVLRRWSWPYLPKGKEINGSWWGEDFFLGSDVTVEAPIVLGNNCKIGDNSQIKSLTAIGNNVEVGKNCIIEKSVLWNNVKVGNNCQITGSILCHDVCLEDDVILKEGCIIGAGTTVTSGTHLTENSILTRE